MLHWGLSLEPQLGPCPEGNVKWQNKLGTPTQNLFPAGSQVPSSEGPALPPIKLCIQISGATSTRSRAAHHAPPGKTCGCCSSHQIPVGSSLKDQSGWRVHNSQGGSLSSQLPRSPGGWERILSLCPSPLQRVILWSLLTERRGASGSPGPKAGEVSLSPCIWNHGEWRPGRNGAQEPATKLQRGWKEPQEAQTSHWKNRGNLSPPTASPRLWW